ncbi:MAG: dienelactone hydrolase family protein [Microthrixaceae bacterium]
MGSIVEFPSNGSSGTGYFAPAEGGGPGVVVVQEWWGIVAHIRDVVDRFAAAGFSAIAPDLFGGETTREPDEAAKLMMALNVDRAVAEMSGAVDFLLADQHVSSKTVGITGYCMGGGLALVAACRLPEKISACAPFYGLIPWESAEPDWSTLRARVSGHYAERDEWFGPEAVAALSEKLEAAGKDATFTIHPGTDHAFFNDTRPEVYDAREAAKAWEDTLTFLRDTIV